MIALKTHKMLYTEAEIAKFKAANPWVGRISAGRDVSRSMGRKSDFSFIRMTAYWNIMLRLR